MKRKRDDDLRENLTKLKKRNIENNPSNQPKRKNDVGLIITIEEKFEKIFEKIKLSKLSLINYMKGVYYFYHSKKEKKKAIVYLTIAMEYMKKGKDVIEKCEKYSLMNMYEEMEKENGDVGFEKDVMKRVIDEIFEMDVEVNKSVGNYWILFYRGICFREMRDNQSSLNDFTKGIELNENGYKLAQLYNERGITFSEMKEFSKSLIDRKKAIELEPKISVFYYGVGVVYVRMKMYQLAIEYFDQCIELNKDNIKSYLLRGECYYKMKMFKECIENYDIVISLNPSEYIDRCYYGKGKSYYQMNMYKESLECLKKAISLKPQNRVYYTQIGCCYMRMEMFDKANLCFNKVIEIKPTWDSFIFKGKAMTSMKKYVDAIYYYTKGIDLFDNFEDFGYIINNFKKERIFCHQELKKKIFGVSFDEDVLAQEYIFFTQFGQ